MHKEIKLTVPFEAICIDNENKPKEIPSNKWLEKKKYTVIGVAPTLDGKLGFKLKEIVLGKESYPFDCFSPIRFAIPYQEKVKTLAEELEELGIKVQDLELEKNNSMSDQIDWNQIKTKTNSTIEELTYEEQQALKKYESLQSEEELYIMER